ncbi:class I SAM-dependent methyltransferase [Streptomyces sp. SID13031]|uniref:class I SAM-dependent methyltransferase n=1 Tax=Streptomyces sp. SID13031 TaxID=2706046 RepID=UPI0013CAD7EC|nr:class I SAM-dependent methyltransferase [Streptomyces sp. SID13031]NEA37128.1 class I SAM-dependent methyltransferase [Streptomyces sp. SID13031]
MVDYDGRLHQVYAQGRALPADSLDTWMQTAAGFAPVTRPLTVLDLGCGIGRFTPSLAETFGGPVYGVEPSAGMRQQAIEHASHPDVTYLEGSAEAIPLPDESCDLVWLFLTIHHWSDPLQGFREVNRVLRPGGTVVLRTQFGDRMPDLYWYRYFPSARQVDATMYLPFDEVQALAARAGLIAEKEPRWVDAPEVRTHRATYERLKLRAFSTFEHLAEDELDRGFAEFERDATADPEREVPAFPAGVLLLRRPSS